MTKYNVEDEIKKLPGGLDRAILRTLSFHKGRHNIISHEKLVFRLRFMGFANLAHRQTRLCISQLRKSGHLICSAPGSKGGFWLPSCRDEYDAFVNQVFISHISDMQETLNAMNKTADRAFGKKPLANQLPML